MKSAGLFALFVLVVGLFAPSSAAERPNVLLLCIDDLRPELGCYGKDYIRSPNIDKLAARGRIFRSHYVQAPTCGASRFALLTGTYGPSSNGALFQRSSQLAKNPKAFPPSFPAWFRKHGYTAVSIGKVSHHPGGRGGPDWNLDSQIEMPDSWDRHLMPVGRWKHPRGAMHGLANGEIRVRAGEMDVYQAVEGDDSIYPDGLTTNAAIDELTQLAADAKKGKPFLLAVGIIRPHLPFGAPKKYLQLYDNVELPPIPHPEKPKGKTTWHGSGEFMKYNRWKRNPNTDPEFATAVRRHYAACVSYADAQVGRLLDQLQQTGQADNTIVVLWGDHGWHLGEHAIWGKHSLFEESLHSPLIISHPNGKRLGESTDSMVETIDVFPTVCDLAGVPRPDYVDGVSLKPQLQDPAKIGHNAISYGRGKTIRTTTHRLILHKSGEIELYDHRSADGETKNIAAQHPRQVAALVSEMNIRLEGPDAIRPNQERLPSKLPKKATRLLGGDDHQFVSMAGERLNWPFEDGQLQSTRAGGRSNHAVSTLHFRDADIHVEFKLPDTGSGNSGVYIHGNYELQIINSHQAKDLSQQHMGAIYGFAAPRTNAARPPGEWQVLDIRYRAPRRDENGAILAQGAITAWLNGKLVQRKTRFGEPRSKYHPYRYGTTPYLQEIWAQQKQTSVGPLFLQDHDNAVAFRNVWITPLDDQAVKYSAKAGD